MKLIGIDEQEARLIRECLLAGRRASSRDTDLNLQLTALIEMFESVFPRIKP